MSERYDVEYPVMPPAPRKGRGAVGNLQGRYESVEREAVDDGWTRDDDGEPRAPLRTQVFEERARTILTRNASPDIPFNVSLNPYRGCEHGCIYCFARPTHSYLGLSPGLDFESRIYAKVNAAELLARELAKPRYVPEPIALGVNTDAYQPVERERRITRQVIQVMHDHGQPFAAITKSSLIERDLDLLAPMAERRQVMAAVTITTLDPELARARAARRDALAPAADDPRAARRGGAGRREHRADDPVRHRTGSRARARGVRGRGGDARELYRVAIAVGGRAAFHRMARRAFSGSSGARDGACEGHARRQGLRRGFQPPDERRRNVGRAAQAALPDGGQALRAERTRAGNSRFFAVLRAATVETAAARATACGGANRRPAAAQSVLSGAGDAPRRRIRH
ncbi:radical SAM domain protein [Burkholderia pseudomallei MSHR346]|nr:radical SAM domain protein [Burkholderia pseudomallei MSHR346]